MGWREGEGLSTLKCLPSTNWEQIWTPCLQTPCLPSHRSVSVKKDWTLAHKGSFSIVLDISEILHMLTNASRAIYKHMGWEYFGGSVEWSQVENFTPCPSSAGAFQLNIRWSYFLQLRPQHFACIQKIATDFLWLQFWEYIFLKYQIPNTETCLPISIFSSCTPVEIKTSQVS